MNAPPDTRQADAPEIQWEDRNYETIRLGIAWQQSLLRDLVRCVSESRAEGLPTALTPSRETLEARKAYEGARAAMIEALQPARIDRLAAIFGLAPFDEDVILLALAPRIDADFASLIEQAQGRPARIAPTPQLSLTLFAGVNGARLGHGRFVASAPLRRFALIELVDPALGALSPLGVDERVAGFLLGDDMADERVARLLFDPMPGPCPERHFPAVERLAGRIGERPPAAAVLTGARRSGRRAAAAELARRFGLGLAELRPRLLPQDIEARRTLLSILSREAALGGFATLLDADPTVPPGDGDARRLAREAAEELPAQLDALVIVVGEDGFRASPAIPHVRLEPLEAADRVVLWRKLLPPDGAIAPVDLDLAAENFKLGPGEIEAIVRDLGSGEGDGKALWRACRETSRAGLEELAERVTPRLGWEDIILPASIVEDLMAIAAQVRHRTEVHGRGGFGRKMTRGLGVTALFAGPSGVGKSMAAEVIAHELDLDLYRIDLSSVVSKYIGETEKNLKRVFDAAEAGGAVLFFDEADALFGKRSEVKDAHDRYANIEVSYLLQRMESYSGLAVLATNMKSHLDAAFLRRLRFVIDFPHPDATQRRAIWAKAFPPETATEGLDLDALARIEIAGGNIVVIAINAAFLAAETGGPVRMTHIARAARAEMRKLDKEFKPVWAADPGAAAAASLTGSGR
jgi:hypothetical protein